MPWRRGKAYAQDLRDRVFALADGGLGVTATADQLRVTASYVSKVLSRRRQTGETTARPQRCQMAPKLATLHGAIQAEVTRRPDATLGDLRRWLADAHTVRVSEGLMHKTLARLGLTLKKSRSTLPSSNAPTSPRRVRNGVDSSPFCGPGGWSSSMKPGPRPT
jgi:transposase